jgi:hypothetical protein
MEENITITGGIIKSEPSFGAPAPEIAKDNEAAVSNTRSWKDFAALINAAWRKGAEAFIQVGRILLEAKEELSKDEFDSLLKSKLDLEASIGRKLMRSASNSILCAHVHKLPSSWSSIYELSKVSGDTLKAAIADSRVNPKMMRKDAIALRKPKNGKAEENASGEDSRTAQPANELLEFWDAATDAEQLATLKHKGVKGILKLLKEDRDFLAELYDRVIGLQTVLAAPVVPPNAGKKLLANLTGTMHWALGQKDTASGAQALTIIKAKLSSNKRDPMDLCFAFAKKRRR